ncbi:MAG: hypothetical protein PHX82_08725 [Paracoccaceae bacterium]|nr:hypothetical protein [Paracoccaceae bacterium]
MTQHRLVTLRLHHDFIAAIESAARAQQLNPAEVIRNILFDALMRAPAPRTPTSPARGLLAVRQVLDAADGWLDLQRRLRHDGFVLRLAGDRLAVHEWPSDHFVIWLDEIGQTLAGLSLRFCAPFPGALPRRVELPPLGQGRGRAA